MKLGYFMQPVHPITRNYREVLDEDREAIILADRLGYEEALLGEQILIFGHRCEGILIQPIL